jgi:hypothetical protein
MKKKSLNELIQEHGINGNDFESALFCLKEAFGIEVDDDGGAVYIRISDQHIYQTERILAYPTVNIDKDYNRDIVGIEIIT